MGVPFFYRWLLERYPCVVRPVDAGGSSIPAVDHLLVDMNGIIHQCTQGGRGAAAATCVGPCSPAACAVPLTTAPLSRS